MEGLLRRREAAGAQDFGRRILVEVGACLVRGTRIRILRGTGTREEARTRLREERDGILADMLATPAKEALPCTAKTVLKLVMLAVAESSCME